MTDQRVAELTHLYLDGIATAAETSELMQRVESEPAASDYFARAARTQALLQIYFDEARTPAAETRSKPVHRRRETVTRRRQPGPRWRALFSVAAAAAAAAFVLAFALPRQGADPSVGTLESVDEGVEICRRSSVLVAQSSMQLQAGDVLTGKPSASATIVGTAGSRLTAGGGFRLTLRPVTPLGIAAHLDAGALACAVGPQRADSPFVVTTPHARARVVGTKFTLSAQPDSTRLDVNEGKVEFSDNAGAQRECVAAGQYATTDGRSKIEALPLEPIGRIDEPRAGASVGRLVKAKGIAERIPSDATIWLVVEIGERIWPKTTVQFSGTSWGAEFIEGGDARALGLALCCADRNAQQAIREWTEKSRASGEYLGLKLEDVHGIKVLSRVRVVRTE